MKINRVRRCYWWATDNADRLERALWWALAVWIPAGIAWIVWDTVERWGK